MKKINQHIEIVGSSNPRLNAMAEDAQKTLRQVLGEVYAKVDVTIVDTLEDLEYLVAKQPDVVVLGMKLILLEPEKGYDDSRKIWLSDYLADKGISYTGSTTGALELEFDKPVAKQRVMDFGLESSRYFISTINNPIYTHTLSYPLFVKPTNRGDSKGIDEASVVHTYESLVSKIDSIHEECASDVLVEEYLPGREFSVAILRQQNSNGFLAMPVEISSPPDAQGNRFLSEAVKEADIEEVSPVYDAQLRDKLNALAIGVFEALGSRDYGRIDLRLNAAGEPSFIEANLMPGLSDHGYLSSCFYLNRHIAYRDMVLSIVALASERVQAPNKNVFARLFAH